MARWLAVGTVNYGYKFLAALALTPAIYAVRRLLDRYLGPELAQQMKHSAATT